MVDVLMLARELGAARLQLAVRGALAAGAIDGRAVAVLARQTSSPLGDSSSTPASLSMTGPNPTSAPMTNCSTRQGVHDELLQRADRGAGSVDRFARR